MIFGRVADKWAVFLSHTSSAHDIRNAYERANPTKTYIIHKSDGYVRIWKDAYWGIAATQKDAKFEFESIPYSEVPEHMTQLWTKYREDQYVTIVEPSSYKNDLTMCVAKITGAIHAERLSIYQGMLLKPDGNSFQWLRDVYFQYQHVQEVITGPTQQLETQIIEATLRL